VRASQAAFIYQALVRTGEWLEVDESMMLGSGIRGDRVEHCSVRELKWRYDKWYLRLCHEDSYHITVDTEKIQVPHVINWNSALVESEFHPNAPDRSAGPRTPPFLLTDENIKFTPDQAITFPVFIPTIPQFIDSCLYFVVGSMDKPHRRPTPPYTDLSYMEQYLVLDSPHQQDKLLAKVKNREGLVEYFAHRQRFKEGRMKRMMERRAKHAVYSEPEKEVSFGTSMIGG